MLEEFAYVWTQGVVLDLLPTSAKYVHCGLTCETVSDVVYIPSLLSHLWQDVTPSAVNNINGNWKTVLFGS